MCGVRSTGCPWHDMSPYPWSSVRMKTMLGRRAAIEAAGTVHAAIHARLSHSQPVRMNPAVEIQVFMSRLGMARLSRRQTITFTSEEIYIML